MRRIGATTVAASGFAATASATSGSSDDSVRASDEVVRSEFEPAVARTVERLVERGVLSGSVDVDALNDASRRSDRFADVDVRRLQVGAGGDYLQASPSGSPEVGLFVDRDREVAYAAVRGEAGVEISSPQFDDRRVTTAGKCGTECFDDPTCPLDTGFQETYYIKELDSCVPYLTGCGCP